MTLTHTTATAEDVLGEPVSEEVAEAQSAALDRVLALLEADGVNAQLIRRVWIEAKTNGSGVQKRWHPPQLVIYSDGGWRVATVAIGPRSGAYTVELAQVGPDNQPLPDRIEVVPAGKAHRVARLITQNKTYQHGRLREAPRVIPGGRAS
ncbi:hypothetical protein HII36_41540 [Nonomuraea sp. NN258]|uniref:hypothetical protein n=1 Tax=Nonomuraea antri TaxID=2730852 RepID=UPI0015690EAE|nr:hypothetical protein [Nonomuraea antri]NRQ38271.1 hypothetical protein [Nonomuraea antri]